MLLLSLYIYFYHVYPEIVENFQATPVKKSQLSKHVIGFCTAVIFEVLGFVTVDGDVVKRILPYVSSGLQPGVRGLDQKVKFEYAFFFL